MLKANEIEKLIKGKKSLPPTADYFEKFYYYALDVCIERYHQDKLTREELKKYQLGYKEIYEQLVMWLEILGRHREIEKVLGHAELCVDGCEKCREELSMATLFLVKERLRIQQLYSRLRLLSEYRHLMMMKGKLRTGKRKKKRIRYVLRRLRSIILK